ncbi:hypothetical protein HPB50_009749 [Hyalomma asiaticum]|uniref:Uncharacterized protein n=1 Tax=Hyalomma asiaticum TaxID=266040 RepID=A0ACB7TIA0_HYAAI|nr:hypothetical protein HPB50_009749 [Hyalomma asiaticum]
MPPPHLDLTRSEAVTYRQLQTGSLPTPVLMKHVCSSVYASDLCRVCKSERATAAHILWDCEQNPREARTVTTVPPWLAAGSDQLEEQTSAIQWISAALEKQHPSDNARCPLPPQHRGRRGCQKKDRSSEGCSPSRGHHAEVMYGCIAMTPSPHRARIVVYWVIK